LTNTSQNTINWSASSSSSDVTFTLPGGTPSSTVSGSLTPTQPIKVTVTFPGPSMHCTSPSLIFKGPTNTVTVTVTCQ
jgi:hypothetical protein